LITSRAFLAAHAIAGTNRRLVEYSYRQFLCRPINMWVDTSATDEYVSLDVTRNPNSDHNKYQTSCRGCHSQLDSIRRVFSRLTFENNFVKHAWVMSESPETDPNAMNEDPEVMIEVPLGISGKMNRNYDTNNVPNPEEKFVKNTSWFNNARGPANAEYFGWDDSVAQNGTKIQELGNMIAHSRAFSECMAKRVFRSVCKREAQEMDKDLIQTTSTSFRSEDQYNLKRLFERIAVSSQCLGR